MAILILGGPLMRTRWFVLILLSTSLAFAQSTKPAQSAPPAPPAAAVQSAPSAPVPDNAAVITIDGVCDPTLPNASKASGPCKVQITKAEFERMINALTPPGTPPLTPAQKRQAASTFAQLMTFAAAGEKNGALNTPDGEVMLKIAKLQALANSYGRQLQKESKPTDAQVQTLYNANADKYQQATIQQLFIPPLKAAEGKPIEAEAQKARAEKFHQRAVAGEPFDKLQKEALEGADAQGPMPPVEFTIQKEKVPANRAFIFDLKPGEVSQLITESSTPVIYKMISKSTIPFADVKDNLAQELQQQTLQSEKDAVLKSATPTLNDAYFGPATPQPTPGAQMPTPPVPGHSPAPPVPPPSPKQPN